MDRCAPRAEACRPRAVDSELQIRKTHLERHTSNDARNGRRSTDADPDPPCRLSRKTSYFVPRFRKPLDWEPSIQLVNIGVGTSDGVVTLTGHAPSHARKREAEKTALRVQGVSGITNDIDVRRWIKKAPGRMASTIHTRAEPTGAEPDVALRLDIDREYRERAPNDLPRIAPHRFNPTSEAWLPVLHTRRDDDRFTVTSSNAERAHALDKIDDWVVIYRAGRVRDPASNRWTAVTETRGPLAGARVVRGREDECAAMLDAEASPGRSGSEANAAQDTGTRDDRDAIRG